MEKYTFTDNGVQSALTGTVLLRANVTDNDADDQALLRHFGIFGPPTIAFYGLDGQERTNYRVVGYMKANAFATRVREALQAPTLTEQGRSQSPSLAAQAAACSQSGVPPDRGHPSNACVGPSRS
jgi:hypothetical protein